MRMSIYTDQRLYFVVAAGAKGAEGAGSANGSRRQHRGLTKALAQGAESAAAVVLPVWHMHRMMEGGWVLSSAARVSAPGAGGSQHCVRSLTLRRLPGSSLLAARSGRAHMGQLQCKTLLHLPNCGLHGVKGSPSRAGD